ncbi:pre-SET motif domain-containing protein [Sarocladium implicatum]|nr:pre-SET motif domain-containing protein [Sarocladium implicatum]
MQAAFSRHFDHHGKGERYDEERNNCHWCQLRSFDTHRTLPITIVNDVDSEVIPEGFRFINTMVYGDGVKPAEDNFRSGCDCQDGLQCQYGGCQCLSDLLDEHEDASMALDGMDHVSHKKKYAYHMHGAKKGLMRSQMLATKLPLYECHSSCSCSDSCPNRVVEQGRKVPLQIFRTSDNRGWGVRATQTIQKGQFLDRYLGEVITSAEADRRRKESAVSQRKDVYLFALDKFSSLDSLDPRLRGPPLEVDGEFMSGPTRFINHSCDPNMRIFARVRDHADKHLHDLALFAIKTIPAMEELTFDYVDGHSDDADDNEPSQGRKSDMTECLCGSANCRKFLW